MFMDERKCESPPLKPLCAPRIERRHSEGAGYFPPPPCSLQLPKTELLRGKGGDHPRPDTPIPKRPRRVSLGAEKDADARRHSLGAVAAARRGRRSSLEAKSNRRARPPIIETADRIERRPSLARSSPSSSLAGTHSPLAVPRLSSAPESPHTMSLSRTSPTASLPRSSPVSSLFKVLEELVPSNPPPTPQERPQERSLPQPARAGIFPDSRRVVQTDPKVLMDKKVKKVLMSKGVATPLSPEGEDSPLVVLMSKLDKSRSMGDVFKGPPPPRRWWRLREHLGILREASSSGNLAE
mmetsp:Transcript_6179/g.14240  ORF Transcript_6179/g.14240 Transcript_6179/m.14240 type:complete len:296 (+) Transcript_6179:204-1091(+)